MRSAFIVSAFAALALAAPRPQDIEFDQVDAAADPIVVAVSAEVVEQTVSIQPLAAVTALAAASVTDVASTTEQKRDFLGVARSLSKRGDGDCSAQPAGTGPTVSTYVP
jgi:hypothetical protein